MLGCLSGTEKPSRALLAKALYYSAIVTQQKSSIAACVAPVVAPRLFKGA